MTLRDKNGIIVQHDIHDETYQDGGDSSRATGMMAMAGSIKDQKLLHLFEHGKTGLLCRHPHQNIFSDTNNFTRDQLVQFIGGVNKAGLRDLAKRIFYSRARCLFFAQNTHNIHGEAKPWYMGRDPLLPSNIGQLIIAARLYYLYPLLPICILWLIIDIIFSAKFLSDSENNQILATCDVYGKPLLKLYTYLNKKWKKSLATYWGMSDSTWRYQKAIGQAIIAYIESRIK